MILTFVWFLVNFAKEPLEQPKDIIQNQESFQNYEKTHWNLLDMIKEDLEEIDCQILNQAMDEDLLTLQNDQK